MKVSSERAALWQPEAGGPLKHTYPNEFGSRGSEVLILSPRPLPRHFISNKKYAPGPCPDQGRFQFWRWEVALRQVLSAPVRRARFGEGTARNPSIKRLKHFF